jgi:tetratricopeptide (TPR) repeat protein
LLPVLGFAQNGGQAMADRFMYLPGIALTIPVAYGCNRLYQQLGRRRIGNKVALISGIIALLTSFAVVTRQQISSWHDTQTLWTRAVSARPHQAGRAYYQRGLYRLDTGEYTLAVEDASRSLEILTGIGYTRIAKVYMLRAEAYEKLGMHQEAARDMAVSNSLPSAWEPQL